MSALPRLVRHLVRRRACSTQLPLLFRQNSKPVSTPRVSISSPIATRNLGCIAPKYSQLDNSQENYPKADPIIPGFQPNKYTSKPPGPKHVPEGEGPLFEPKTAPDEENPLLFPKKKSENDEDLVYPSDTMPEYQGPLFEPKEKEEDDEDIPDTAEENKANSKAVGEAYLAFTPIMLDKLQKALERMENNEQIKDTLNDILIIKNDMEHYVKTQSLVTKKFCNGLINILDKIINGDVDLAFPIIKHHFKRIHDSLDRCEAKLDELKNMQELFNRALLFWIVGTFGFGLYSIVANSADGEGH